MEALRKRIMELEADLKRVEEEREAPGTSHSDMSLLDQWEEAILTELEECEKQLAALKKG